MSATSGEYPIDNTSGIGQLRTMLGDTTATNIDETTSMADYALFGDADLATFIAAGSGSVLRGAAYASLQLALDAARRTGVYKTYDLSVDLSAKAASYRAQANVYFTRADDEDENLSNDTFIVDNSFNRPLPPIVTGGIF